MDYKPSYFIDGIKFIPSFRFNKGYTRLNYLHLDVTSKCNLKCKMCEWRYKVSRREMPWNIYKKAIDEGRKIGLRKIIIAATGESMTHRDFPKMIDYASKNHLDIELVTNLTLLNERSLKSILNVKRLAVSIDGATKETYEKIRVGANFERTLRNLKLILEKKGDMHININYVVQKDNFREIDRMADLLGSLGGIDKITFKFSHNELDEIYDKIKLSDEDLNEFKEKIKVAAEKLKEYNIKSNLSIDGECQEDYLGSYKPWIHQIPCYNLWFGAFINPEGLVFPCCDFYKDKDALGDLKTQSLKEIWNSQEYNVLRRRFKGRKPKICEGCPGDNRHYHRILLKIPLHKFLLDIDQIDS